MKTTTYIETIYKTWCPYCDKTNLTNNGNESDVSGYDEESVVCEHCNKEYKLFDNDF